MNSIFATTTSDKIQLSKDPSAWMSEVSEFLFSQYPFLTQFGLEIKFNKVNAEKGYGVGVANIISPSTTVNLPIIVRNFELAPVDVMMIEDEFYPFTPQRFLQIVSLDVGDPSHLPSGLDTADRALQTGMVPPEGYGPLPSNVMTGTMNLKYGSSRNLKNTLFIKLLSKMGMDDVNYISEKLISSIKPLVKYRIDNILKEAEVILDRLPKKVFMIQKGKSPNYILRYVTAVGGMPVSTEMSPSDLALFLTSKGLSSDSIFAQVDQTGSYIYQEEVPTTVPIPIDDAPVKEMDCPGTYMSLREDGTIVKGSVYFNINGEKVFICGDLYSYQPVIYGIYLNDDLLYGKKEFPLRSTGFIRVGSTPKVIGPIFIKSTEVEGRFKTISGILDNTMPCNISFSVVDTNNVDIQYSNKEVNITVPPNSTFLQTRREISLPVSKEDFLERISLIKQIPTIKYLGGQFIIEQDVDQPVSKLEALFLIASKGVPVNVANKILTYVEKKGSASFLNMPFSIKSPVKYIFKKSNSIIKLKEKIKNLSLKTAAETQDTNIIDSILSLNILSPSNLSDFVQSIPYFEIVISKLAKFLVLSRLGLKDVNEDDIKDLLFGLEKVLNVFREIKLGLEKSNA